MEPRLRASPEQFSALIEFMESHGDLSRPQGGPQGRLRGDRLWQELTSLLNSIGGAVNRSQDKWKKVWADWKTKTKKKYMLIRRHASGTGGGPSSRQTLTPLEERVVSIIGVSAVVGQAHIQEVGFNTTSEPVQQVAESEIEQSHYDVEMFEDVHDVLPSTSRTPEPPAWTPPTPVPATLPPETQPSPSQRHSQPPSPPRRRQPQASPLRRQQPPTPPRRQPPPSPARRQPPSTPSRRGRQPPLNRDQVSASPETTPRRRLHLTARRNRGLTPFDRAASEFAAVEQRRLQLEESRERWLHEREVDRIEVARERNQIAREHNELLRQLGVIAELLLGLLSQNRPSNSLASTDILPE